ncbi:MAG: class I SAM-dependent methyltransferase [Candidatus Pacebacteria bacterium]|nr:class I SAM-dependent methyltransferase [Candidatus Paceibacterota bacterium]
MIKDPAFYNKESMQYSAKRYPAVATNYVQFFFKRRLSLTLSQMRGLFGGSNNLSLLEIGCADGVVMRDIQQKLPAVFSSMTGIDTAKDMIVTAATLDSTHKMKFYVRGEEPIQTYDAVVEVGVVNYADFDTELAYARDHLKAGQVYILSIAGKGSLNARLGDGVGYNNFLSYSEYQTKIRALFDIKKTIPVGLRIPFMWRVPFVARLIQPIAEIMLSRIVPNLFHEKIYILRKR